MMELLTEADKESAWITLYEFINDQDDHFNREHIDWLLALLEEVHGGEIK